MSKPRNGRNPSITAWIESMSDWHCPSCGAVASIEDTSCRWNGEQWEHRCPERHPQSGCIAMEKRPAAPPESGPDYAEVTESGLMVTTDMGAGGGAEEVLPSRAGFGADRGTFIIAPDFDAPLLDIEQAIYGPEVGIPGEVIPLVETGGEAFPVTSEVLPGVECEVVTESVNPAAINTLFGCPVIAVFPPPGSMPERTAEQYENDLYR